MVRIGRPAYLTENADQIQDAKHDVEALPERPLISVAMPTYETEPRYLREAVSSLLHQHYPEWELCIVDDGSQSRATRRALERCARQDSRIKVEYLEQNGGISAATNAALAMCSGEIVAFLDHDDALTPDALLKVAQAFGEREIDVFYSDQDKITPRGEPADPFLKPDWSPVYALGAMYIGHLLAVRRSLAEQAGGFDSAFDTIQDFEFMLRLSEHTQRIHHSRDVLYHWRAIEGSIAQDPGAKSGVEELQARAVSAHLERRGVAARAVSHPSIPHRARLVATEGAERPKVSVVIAAGSAGSAQLQRCLTSLGKTSYPDYEVIVVGGELNGAGPIRLLDDPRGGYSTPAQARNLGARQASGTYLAFLSEWAEIASPEWIDELLVYAGLPGVGAAGSVMVRPSGMVDAAGYAIGMVDPVLPLMRGFPARADGYYGSLPCAREVSAIGADCLLIERALFEQLDGFREIYSCEYEDFDLSRRVWAAGRSVVCVPGPGTLVHEPEAERLASTDIVDRALFVDSFYEELERPDPFYNLNFSNERGDYSLADDSFLPEPQVSTWMADE